MPIEGIGKRFIAEDLIVEGAEPVAPMVTIKEGQMQGSVVHPVGIIVQFYSGGPSWPAPGSHYVCILDFEDWGTEKCPRFTWYAFQQHDSVDMGDGNIEHRSHYIRTSDPSFSYEMPKENEL